MWPIGARPPRVVKASRHMVERTPHTAPPTLTSGPWRSILELPEEPATGAAFPRAFRQSIFTKV
jgi:hypothetical protein